MLFYWKRQYSNYPLNIFQFHFVMFLIEPICILWFRKDTFCRITILRKRLAFLSFFILRRLLILLLFSGTFGLDMTFGDPTFFGEQKISFQLTESTIDWKSKCNIPRPWWGFQACLLNHVRWAFEVETNIFKKQSENYNWLNIVFMVNV